MGDYAGFVWPAYGVAALILGISAFTAFHALKSAKRELSTLQAVDHEA